MRSEYGGVLHLAPTSHGGYERCAWLIGWPIDGPSHCALTVVVWGGVMSRPMTKEMRNSWGKAKKERSYLNRSGKVTHREKYSVECRQLMWST